MVGPEPLFPQPVVVGRPNLGDRARLRERIEDVLDRRWLSNDGPYLRQFEARAARDLGVRHALAVCNATIGLQMAVRALGMATPRRRGEAPEVIVPSFTFAATVHALAWEGVRPVFVDVDQRSHCVDPAEVESLITPRTTGIVGVHLWGNLCDDAVGEVARRHGLPLLYDAAHAYGCTDGARTVGDLGDATVFSFHATKFVSCGEGGLITTNNDLLAEKLRRLRSFGVEGDQPVEVGTNAKLDELSAVMGLTSLEHAEEFVAQNRAVYRAYEEALEGVAGLRLAPPISPAGANWQYVVVEVDPHRFGRTRDGLVAELARQNVIAKRYFWPGCHRMRPYRDAYAAQRNSLPRTEWLCETLMQLPTGSAVTPEEASQIGRFLRDLTETARRAA